MGSFEKLGVLVIIVLVVVIVVVAAWGGDSDDRLATLADDGGYPAIKGDVDPGVTPDPTPDPDPAPDPDPTPDPDPGPDPDPTPDPSPADEITHVIKKNDSLWALAAHYLGNGTKWRQIEKANPGIDPGRLREGTVLKIPSRSAAAPRPGPDPIAPRPGTRAYVVKKGDSFWRIARDQLGRGSRFGEIAELNPKFDSGRLHENDKLLIPAR